MTALFKLLIFPIKIGGILLNIPLITILFKINQLKKLGLCIIFPPYIIVRILRKLIFLLYLRLMKFTDILDPFK